MKNFIYATFVEVVEFALLWLYDIVLETIYFIFRCRPRKDIKNENILITGSGQGLGRLVTNRLATDGNILHCVDLNETLNQKMKEDLKDRDCTIYIYKCDVGEPENITNLGKQIKENVPDRHISYLFNIAGIVMGKSFEEETEQQMLKVMKVNVMGVLYLQKMVFKEMKENYGHIVNISSLAGIVPGPLIVDYCASKYAIRGISQAMLSEMDYFGIKNVKVTSIYPHITKTGMFNNTKAKWPNLFPLLEPNWVADEIIIAARESREQVILPKRCNVFMILEHLMSAKLYRKYGEVMGSGLMKTFQKIRKE